MKFLLPIFLVLSLSACSQEKHNSSTKTANKKLNKPHKFGGWYCPDNLLGFPATDLNNWSNVPVINNRLPSKEETLTEASLIYIDETIYPDAKPLDIKLPQIATYYNKSTNISELIIIIQAVIVSDDTIVGFRFLDGGNGSSHYNEITLLPTDQIDNIDETMFISHQIKVNTSQKKLWDFITKSDSLTKIYPTYNNQSSTTPPWKQEATIDFNFVPKNLLTHSFGGEMYGAYYIQNNYTIDGKPNYSEKLLLLENEEDNTTDIILSFGPFKPNDIENKNSLLTQWLETIKENYN